MPNQWKIYNHSGTHRILVTKELPGSSWLKILTDSNYLVEVNSSKSKTSKKELKAKLEDKCAGVIGQLTENWDKELFMTLRKAGGKVYSNYAVGYDNIKLEAASKNKIAIGNTPGVLTETTAEMACALTFACARRIVESDHFMRSGKYDGWLPGLLLGERLTGKTLGIVGAGRIGSAYAIMMAYGFRMNIIYYSRTKNEKLAEQINCYNDYEIKEGDSSINIRKVDSLDELLTQSDVVSLHTVLNEETHHLIKAEQLSQMKDHAILINTSRGSVIDEKALANHCKNNHDFKVGLDVFEDEPSMNNGLKKLANVTVTPHTASATRWTREAMAILAALNINGIIEGYPLWDKESMEPFLQKPIPKATPSIVNAQLLERLQMSEN